MAQKPLTNTELERTVKAVIQTGSRLAAARKLGIPLGTLDSRVKNAKARGFNVPSFEHKGAPTKPLNLTGMAGDISREKKRADMLEARLARLQAVKVPKPQAVKKRRGKDDTIRVIFPDLHGYYQDTQAVAAFLSDVKTLAPDEVIGLGDLIDCGGFLAQHHVMGFVAETSYTYEQDIAAAGAFLDALAGAAPGAQIDLIEGNHCARPERWAVTSALRNQVDSEFLRRLNAPATLLDFKGRGIRYYRRAERYDNLPVPGAIRRGKACFVHGLIRGGSAPEKLLSLFGTNVFYGHTHRAVSVLTRSVTQGVIGAFNLGCLSQLQPLWQHGDPTTWTHGYGIQIVARSGNFLPLMVPIVDGVSLLPEMRLR